MKLAPVEVICPSCGQSVTVAIVLSDAVPSEHNLVVKLRPVFEPDHRCLQSASA